MIKIGEIISRVESLYSSGISSDDIALSKQLIYSKMLSVRSKLISQSLNKKQGASSWISQTIDCVELEEVPIVSCPCLPNNGCTILRSKHKIPKPIDSLMGDMLTRVSTVDMSHKIDYITINSYRSAKGNKFTSRKMNYFIDEGYLYISTPKKIKAIMIEGLFENPIEAYEFQTLCGCDTCPTCLDYNDLPFPIDSSSIDTLVELISQELVILYKQIPKDTLNNSVEDTNQIK
jgi:hypothetical protein